VFHVPGEEDWKEFTLNFDSCDMQLFLEKLLALYKILLLQTRHWSGLPVTKN
jgi:hypothetical protein